MRLIDADIMYQRFCVDKTGLDGIYDVEDLPDILVEMPTIDAIPVEWLRKIADDTEIELNDRACIKWLIGEWQKEQEAQDGTV